MLVSFRFRRLKLPEVILVESRPLEDERGHFVQRYQRSAFESNGIELEFVQDNHARSLHAVLRGLHYQAPPAAQAKLISVPVGEIFDVAVDIRVGSATYAQWVGVTLSEKNHHQLYVPVGFAHGYCVLSDTAEVTYKVSHEYSPEHERGIAWNDPEIGIEWPIEEPLLSARDLQAPTLAEAEKHFSKAEQPG